MSVDQMRALGLTMGSRYAPYTFETEGDDGEPATVTTQRYRSWTTDQAKADAARELGATVEHYVSSDPRFSGWEVTVNEVVGG